MCPFPGSGLKKPVGSTSSRIVSPGTMNHLSGLTTLTPPRWEAHLPVFQVTVTVDPSLPGIPANTPNI